MGAAGLPLDGIQIENEWSCVTKGVARDAGPRYEIHVQIPKIRVRKNKKEIFGMILHRPTARLALTYGGICLNARFSMFSGYCEMTQQFLVPCSSEVVMTGDLIRVAKLKAV